MFALIINAQDYIDNTFSVFDPKVFTYSYQHKGEVSSFPICCAIVSLNTMEDLVLFNSKLKERSRHYNGLIVNYSRDNIEITKTQFNADDIVCENKDQMMYWINQCGISFYIYDGYIE